MLVVQIKNLNVQTDATNATLRLGYGQSVIEVMTLLTTIALSKLPKPKQPEFKNVE